MEPFIDCGLFEILFVVGFTSLAVFVYRRGWVRLGVLAIGVIAPILLIVLAESSTTRTIAIVCAASSLVNTYVVLVASKNRDLVSALQQSQIDLKAKAMSFMKRIMLRE